MAGKEGKHNARKPKRSSQINEIYSRPMKEGSGLAPTWSQEAYKGIQLHPHIKARMDAYAELKSLTVADIARMLT